MHDDQDGGCVSHVGYIGSYEQNNYLNLAPGLGVGSYGCLHKSIISHEFLHAMGMMHEQERPDRDNYVTIHWNNIQDRDF